MAIDTKQMITEKLFELLSREKTENVTVKRLVEECGISRQTFYYHFKDIIDVMEWGCRQALKDDLETGLRAESPREAITVFVTNTVNRRAAVSHLLASPHGPDFLQLMQKTVKTYLWEMFGRMFPNSRLSVADTEAVLDFFTGGITGLILGNYSKRNLDTGALVDQIDRLLSGEMRAALLGREFSAGAQ